MQAIQNYLLGGRISLLQPEKGYRTAIDPIFLAAALDPKPHESVLEVGAGVGTAMLCLAARVPLCQVTGIELQSELVQLGQQNILSNTFEDRLRLINGNLRATLPGLLKGTFHHVMMNPPYSAGIPSSPLASVSKALAHFEGEVTLKEWLEFCFKRLKPRGTLTLIHKADRLDEILTLLQGKWGEIIVFPLWPKQGRPAKRLLIRARKDSASPCCLKSGMTLHREDGSYTFQAKEILREGGALSLK